MSLLMQALKKAELAKKNSQGAADSTPTKSIGFLSDEDLANPQHKTLNTAQASDTPATVMPVAEHGALGLNPQGSQPDRQEPVADFPALFAMEMDEAVVPVSAPQIPEISEQRTRQRREDLPQPAPPHTSVVTSVATSAATPELSLEQRPTADEVTNAASSAATTAVTSIMSPASPNKPTMTPGPAAARLQERHARSGLDRRSRDASSAAHGIPPLEPLPAAVMATKPTQVQAQREAPNAPVPTKSPAQDQTTAQIALGEQTTKANALRSSTAAAQALARTIFSAKRPKPTRRTVILAAAALLTLSVVSGGSYLYWTLDQLNTSSALQSAQVKAKFATPAIVSAVPATTMPTTMPTTVPTNAPTNTPTAAVTPAESATGTGSSNGPSISALAGSVAQSMANSVANTVNGSVAKITPTAAPTTLTSTNEGNNRNTADSKPQSSLRTSASKTKSGTPDANAVQFQKKAGNDPLMILLDTAYRAFTAGDSGTAEQLYQQALKTDPINRDALMGLAAIAMNAKQFSSAAGHYLKLLEQDPNDPDAIAGLTSMQQSDPTQGMSRLKKILAQNPDSAPALFVLGNLYAQESHWADAQQNYFRAVSKAPGNADYAFNLAVSLDRLNQAKLAVDYYERALSAHQTRAGNFNAEAVQQRVRQLQLSLAR